MSQNNSGSITAVAEFESLRALLQAKVLRA